MAEKAAPGDGARAAIATLTPTEVNRRLEAVRARALGMPAAGSSGAVIGFCWGGSRFFDFAAAQKDLKAAVGYYGTAPTDRETLRLIACPVPGSV